MARPRLPSAFFRGEDAEGRLVHILSPAGKNLDDVAKVIPETLEYVVEVGGETSVVRSMEAGGEIGVFSTLRARFVGRKEDQQTRRTELVVTNPTDQGLLEVMAEREVILVIDEMHKAPEGFRLQLADLIKSASNLGGGFPRIVVLGTTLDASRLVERDEGIDRLITEIRVRPMTDEEAETVVRVGMASLGIEIADEQVERIVRTAAGAPALVQEICLDVAERAHGDERPVRDDDIDEAIRLFLLNSQARLTAKYMSAIETTGPRRYRKQILRAMAESSSDLVTMDELCKSVSGYLGEEVPSTTLSGPLRELKHVSHGKILMDVERPAGEGRVFNLTAFNDPRMKAFIRAMNAVEEQGLLPSGRAVASLPPPENDGG